MEFQDFPKMARLTREVIVTEKIDGTNAQVFIGEGGEMPLTTWYLCDRCAGLYESLDSLGFCGLLGPARVKFDAHGATERVLWATQKDTARWVAMFMDRRRA